MAILILEWEKRFIGEGSFWWDDGWIGGSVWFGLVWFGFICIIYCQHFCPARRVAPRAHLFFSVF